MFFMCSNFLNGQALLKYPNNQTTFYDGNGNLGIGITNPSAKLHLYSVSGFLSQPMFKAEIRNSYGVELAAIQHLVTIGNQNFGIYQTHQQGTVLLNYFQDPIKTGNFTLKTGSNSTAVIKLDPVVNSFDFVFDPGQPPSDPVTPLSVNISGIRVRTDLVTDNFQMITGAGANKIMVSDATGRAIWTDPPSGVAQPWLVTKNRDIVSNREYHYIGIGTEEPKKMLDIFHSDPQGGISVTQMLNDNENGSEISFHKNTEESIIHQFSMGHGYFDSRSSFFIWSHLDNNGEGKTELFMDVSNGMTGIGTEWPSAKLEVAGDMIVQTKLGVNCVPPDDDLYKLFVEGGIEARKIRVTTHDYPDYCFKDDYTLMPLQDLRKFIALYKHLPDVPTAQEIEKNNGVELGEMQTILLKKVEEQTLYILDLQKQIDELKTQMGKLISK